MLSACVHVCLWQCTDLWIIWICGVWTCEYMYVWCVCTSVCGICVVCTCVCGICVCVYKYSVSIYVCMCGPEEDFGHPALSCLCHLSLRQSPSRNLYLSWQLGSPSNLPSTSCSVTCGNLWPSGACWRAISFHCVGEDWGFFQSLWTSEAASGLCLFPAAAPAETMQGTR